jgi:4-carboxymuconolactone decarboxylase
VVRGPFAIWLRHPELVDKANVLGNHLREGTDVPQKLSKLAILVTARAWNTPYEWYAHERMAIECGVAREIVEAIRANDMPVFDDPEDECVYKVTLELQRDKAVSDATYGAAVAAMGEDRVIDLVAIIGFCTMVAITLNAFNAPLPDGAEYPF